MCDWVRGGGAKNRGRGAQRCDAASNHVAHFSVALFSCWSQQAPPWMSSDVSADSAGDNTNWPHHCLTDSKLLCLQSEVSAANLVPEVSHLLAVFAAITQSKWHSNIIGKCTVPCRARQTLFKSSSGDSAFRQRQQFFFNPDKLKRLIRWRRNSRGWERGRGGEMRGADGGFDSWTRARSTWRCCPQRNIGNERSESCC